MRYYLKAFKNYAVSGGRASRKEYWFFVLFHFLIIYILAFADGFLGMYDIVGDDTVYGLLSGFYILISMVPMICLQIRRLHDVGERGAWCLASVVPLLCLYLFYLNVKSGDPMINKYGPPTQNDHDQFVPINRNNSLEETAKIEEIAERNEEEQPLTLQHRSKVVVKKAIKQKETEVAQSPSEVQYCRKCGTKLMEDSDFCHKCGSKVN